MQNVYEEILRILYKENVVRDLEQEEDKEALENLKKPVPAVFVTDKLELSAKLSTLADLKMSLLDIYKEGKSVYGGERGLNDPKTAELLKVKTKGLKSNQGKQEEKLKKKVKANDNLEQQLFEEKQKVTNLQDELEAARQNYNQLESQLEKQKQSRRQALLTITIMSLKKK